MTARRSVAARFTGSFTIVWQGPCQLGIDADLHTRIGSGTVLKPIMTVLKPITPRSARYQFFPSAVSTCLGSLCVASTQILLFLRRFSLRPSAYLGGLCVNDYFTAERAETRRGPRRRKTLTATLLRCVNSYFTAERAEIRRGPRRRIKHVYLG
jgi:hypothetical protein